MPCPPPLLPEDDHSPLLASTGAEAGFIALHPFRAVQRMAAEARGLLPHGPGDADEPARAVSKLFAFARQRASAGKREQERLWREIERLERRHGVALRWDQVGAGAGLAEPARLYRALVTGAGSAHPRHEDMAGAAQLATWCQRHDALQPSQGAFQPLMQKPIGTAFAEAGIGRIRIADEFGEEIDEIDAATLASDEPWEFAVGGAGGSLYAPDRSMMFAVRWDGFFTLVCGSHARLVSARLEELFDGFWCTPDTPHGWWMGDRERELLRSFEVVGGGPRLS